MPKVKRLNKVIHPNSRKAIQLAAKENRKMRTQKSHDQTKVKQGILIRKLLWFRDQIVSNTKTDDISDEPVESNHNQLSGKSVLTNDDIHGLIELYFHRFDDELEQIKTKKSIGKRNIGQNFSREKSIEMTLKTELNEYETTGLVLPDLTNLENVALLKSWNGQANVVPTIKLKAFKKNVQ